MDNNQEQKAAEKYPEGSAGYLDKRAGYIAAMEDAENAFLENLIEELPSLQIKSFTPPFRVGRAQKRAILDSEGKEVGVFKTGSEEMAQIFCDYLNGANQLPGVEEWVSVKDELPPFGERLWFRGVVSWKKETVKHFEDELTTKNEELEYGQTGWLLKDNTDFVVTDSVFPIEDLASEYVTHWRKLPEPPRV